MPIPQLGGVNASVYRPALRGADDCVKAGSMRALDDFQASLETVAAICEDVVPPVYAALFRRFPEFEALFSLDLDRGVRGHMLNEALNMAEGLLQNDPMAQTFVSAERMNHSGYGIEGAAFESFYVVLAEVFRDLAGARWTPDMSAAWENVAEAARMAKL